MLTTQAAFRGLKINQLTTNNSDTLLFRMDTFNFDRLQRLDALQNSA
jgi:hypothetical protein